MKNRMMIRAAFVTAAVMFLGTILSPVCRADEGPTVAIVLSVNGDLLVACKPGGVKTELKPAVTLTKSCVITAKKGGKSPKLQIGTIDGPIVFRKFPVRIESIGLKAIPEDLSENYIASIGGSVLRGADVRLHGTHVFEWYTSVGALDDADVKNGFAIVMSPTRNSKTDRSLDPLCFRLKPGITITEARYAVIVDTTGVLFAEGEWPKKDGEFVFAFRSIPSVYGVDYRVETVLTLKDGSEAEWSFVYTVYGPEDIASVEEEAHSLYAEKDRDFERKLKRAGKYQGYNFRIKALAILKSANIDIEEMM